MMNRCEKRVVTVYETLVAYRLGLPRWTCSKRQAKMAGRVCELLRKNKLPLPVFIVSQFEMLSEKFCVKAWKMRYPPLACMMGNRAINRYLKWERRIPNSVTRKTLLLNQQALIYAVKNKDLGKLLVASGRISAECLAVFDEEELKEFLDYIPRPIKLKLEKLKLKEGENGKEED